MNSTIQSIKVSRFDQGYNQLSKELSLYRCHLRGCNDQLRVVRAFSINHARKSFIRIEGLFYGGMNVIVEKIIKGSK